MMNNQTKHECSFFDIAHIHPCNVGPLPLFICNHPSWESNKRGDFEPAVNCGADVKNCDMKKYVLREY
ncbi:MAG: hypothetical protein GY804_06830 [Alphaproteobacteria bacterium]|nr:hypothetical protein [Alphaproteobacteria bacterium]